MKKIIIASIALAMFTFSSCKKNGEKTEESTAPAVAAPAAPAADKTPAFQPFQVMAITQTVKNYEVWKKAFDDHESVRAASGLTVRALARGTDNPNKVYVFLNVSDMQKAKDFAASPNLKEVMQKAGVMGKPVIIYSDVVRFEESPAALKGRVRVASKVKDFDAWLKVFDAEGKDTRASFGLVDRAIARDIENPNMVYLTFAISDLEKVKARIKSPELQKIMIEAGVISKPVIDYYTSVN